MSRLYIPVCLAALLALVCSARSAADNRKPGGLAGKKGQAAEQAEIAALVRGLGAPTFAERQRAQRALVELGVRAKLALETAMDDPDQEIRKRARAALEAVYDVDFHARLKAFADENNLDAGHGLAGWDRFRAIAGSSEPARRLFVEMQRAERELLELVERAPRQAGDLLDARCQQAETDAQTGDSEPQPALALATIAAILFAASETEVPISSHAGNCINGFGNQTSLTQALNAKQMAPITRGLLGAWVGREFDRDSITGYRNVVTAMQYNLKEATGPALALIEPPGGPAQYEPWAILAVGKLGGREQLPALLPLLDDSRSIGQADSAGRESDTQIRDVALAVLVHLTEQKLADYGFVHAKTNSAFLFNTNTLGFNDPNAREQALAKWRSWWNEHK